MKKVVLGVGNRLSRDDGAGPSLIDRMRDMAWTAIDAGTSLENLSGKIREMVPDLLVIADAAEMGLPPGSLRRLPLDATDRMLASTHGLPLPFVIGMFRSAARDTVLIGVEPGDLSLGEGLSPPVQAAVDRLRHLLETDAIDRIPTLEDRGPEGAAR